MCTLRGKGGQGTGRGTGPEPGGEPVGEALDFEPMAKAGLCGR